LVVPLLKRRIKGGGGKEIATSDRRLVGKRLQVADDEKEGGECSFVWKPILSVARKGGVGRRSMGGKRDDGRGVLGRTRIAGGEKKGFR